MVRNSEGDIRGWFPWVTVLLLVCIAALVLSACGSGGSSGSDSNSGSTESSAGSTDSSTVAAKAAGKPIKVGFFSPDVGVGGSPEAGYAEEAAVTRINEQMEGINGRPLEVSVCHTDVAPEKNISCANEFVQDEVVAVVDGFDAGSGAALPILHDAGIPIVGPVAWTTEGEGDTKADFFGPSQAVFGIGPLQSFKAQGQTSVTFAAGDIPAGRGYLDGFVAPAAKKIGLNFKAVYYPLVNPNFQSIASTIAASNPDVGGVPGTTDEGQCTALVEALRSGGYDKSIFAGFCTAFIDAMGPQAAGEVQVYSSIWLPQMRDYAPSAIQQQIDTAVEDLDKVGDPSKHGFFTYATYAAWMTFAEVLRGVKGPIDTASITTALDEVKNLQSFLGPKITCNHTKWPNSSACSNELIVATLQEDGSLKPNDEGGFLAVSPSILSQE
jgi:branched-chain amino acid transport system substrate-binding protein